MTKDYFKDNKLVMIKGYTEFILDLEKKRKIVLQVLDNSDFISLYKIGLIDESILEDEKIRTQLFNDIKELQDTYF